MNLSHRGGQGIKSPQLHPRGLHVSVRPIFTFESDIRRVPCGSAPGDAGPGGDGVLPPGDVLGAERSEFAFRPRRPDEPPDQVLTGFHGADPGVLHGQPPVDPLGAVAAWAWSKRHWVFRKLADKHPAAAQPGQGVHHRGRLRLSRPPLPSPAHRRTGWHSRETRSRSAPDVTRQRGGGPGGEAMIRWYRRCAQAWLPQRIRSWADFTGVQPGGLDVRDLGVPAGAPSARTTG